MSKKPRKVEEKPTAYPAKPAEGAARSADDPAGTQLGYSRLEQALIDVGRSDADEVLQHLVESLASFRGGRPADDDITLVVAEVRA